jgi:hypothetical protein
VRLSGQKQGSNVEEGMLAESILVRSVSKKEGRDDELDVKSNFRMNVQELVKKAQGSLGVRVID